MGEFFGTLGCLPPQNQHQRNIQAFLDTIAVSEGTFGHGEHGYNVLVGGDLFHGYSRHPHKLVDLGHGLKSTAAGRYQFLARTWDALAKKLSLPDFSPHSQDLAAEQLIRGQRALADVADGRFARAVRKVSNIWASLPGAGYGQHENTLAHLRDVYLDHGGQLAPDDGTKT